MTLHDLILSAAIVVFGGIFSGIVQAKFSALDPNAKRLAYKDAVDAMEVQMQALDLA